MATTTLDGSDAEKHAIDIKELSDQDIKILQEKDPSMEYWPRSPQRGDRFRSCYYSIPGIRMATLHSKVIDPSDKDVLCRCKSSITSYSSTSSADEPSSDSSSSRPNTPSSGVMMAERID